MEKQTENYIILKPIAERFNNVAKEISDDDIKYIIKEEMREQIKKVIDFSQIEELVDTYIEENTDDITKIISDSIKDRFKFK